MNKIICSRCGEKAYEQGMALMSVMNVDRNNIDNCIQDLMSLEGVSKEVATDWAVHYMYKTCKEKKRNCPECNLELKTWRAKMCLSCGAEFEPWKIDETT